MAQENTGRVITIAATEQPQDIRLRVAAYARVSSSSDEQLNSFAAQNRYYTELISGKDNWQLVDIYADEGITGTSIEKRDDFQAHAPRLRARAHRQDTCEVHIQICQKHHRVSSKQYAL